MRKRDYEAQVVKLRALRTRKREVQQSWYWRNRDAILAHRRAGYVSRRAA